MCNEFKDAIRAAGLVPPDTITTGKIIHFAGLNKPKTNKAARCLLFEDGRGGWFMDYSTGLYEVWQAERATPYTAKEREAFAEQCERDRIARERDRVEAQAKAARKARRFMNNATVADTSNAYLHRKKIQSNGAKTGGTSNLTDVLILPVFSFSEQYGLALVNVQFIAPDGEKRFLSGGQKKGCFWWLGNKTAVILIAEGFATAASLYESTGNQVFIAYDAGNLIHVARIVRAKNPTAEIIIAGDNDVSGTGQTAARAAALAINGKYIIPPTVGHDWNDHVNTGGVL
jgi:putative DNA primase/helicase